MKVAFVVQRYGLDVVGGAETLCRQVAERLSPYIDVHVLTTCALGYDRWANHYPAGTTRHDSVTVHRFPVSKERDRRTFDRLSKQFFLPGGTLDYPTGELEWMLAQGPRTEELLRHIRECRDGYDVFMFFTYLYYSTFWGLPLVAEKSILLPTAHDEPPIYLDLFRSRFHMPRFIVFLTEEERNFVHMHFRNEHIPCAVIGMGIETPPDVDGERFRNRHRVSGPFVLYAGRISPSKSCHELFAFFLRYKEESDTDLKLLLLGRAEMPIPEHSDIRCLGFVSEQEKFDGFQAAEVMVVPSRFESLSIVSLEALSVGTPLLVNGASDVLREHCIRSNGGLYYRSYQEFATALTLLLQHDALRQRLGGQGTDYVARNYPWGTMERRYLEVIEHVADGGKIDEAEHLRR